MSLHSWCTDNQLIFYFSYYYFSYYYFTDTPADDANAFNITEPL